MILDLDHFKRINDTYGHDVGDVVLKEVAAMLRKSLRAMDIVCRIGGEEFLVICRDTDSNNACRCRGAAAAIRRSRLHYGWRQPTSKITISIGVASKDAGTQDVQTPHEKRRPRHLPIQDIRKKPGHYQARLSPALGPGNE